MIKLIKFLTNPFLKRRRERKAREEEAAARRDLEAWASTIVSSPDEVARIADEFTRLESIKGITREEYEQYELQNKSEEYKRTFLGVNEKRYYFDYLNPIKYCAIARNKYLTHRVLGNTGLRKSILYCYYHPEAVYYDSDECANNVSSVLRILKAKGVTACAIKDVEGTHGQNVQIIKNIDYCDGDATLTRFDGGQVMLSSLLSDRPLIIESMVYQNSQFASFNQSSVNTIRFHTALYPDGSVKIFHTFIRIGRAGKCIDNVSDGWNIDAIVDDDTGEIIKAFQFNDLHSIIEVDSHPDSGSKLTGVFINGWPKIIEEVKRFQQAFPYCKVAGWDIAITDEGPLIIEVNDFWDTLSQSFYPIGYREPIRDCFLAWKQTGKTYYYFRKQNQLSEIQLRAIVDRSIDEI